MANGFDVAKRLPTEGAATKRAEAKLGSRRIFAPQFKLQVLDSYRTDAECKGNQRATARKYGIHRRQIQKWLQGEEALRGAVRAKGNIQTVQPLDCTTPKREIAAPTLPQATGPVDLSLKRPASSCVDAEAPGGAWDLSQKRFKYGYEQDAPVPPAVAPSKPTRLFRPYLDNYMDEIPNTPSPPPQRVPISPAMPEYHDFQYEPQCYRYESLPFHCYETSAFEEVIPRFVEERPSPLSSPLSGAEYENLVPASCASRYRQSYTMDFKLQVVQSYHQDLECRGNQRAVASKFRVHRRQVQKWLQQEDHIKERNDGPRAVALMS